MKQEQQTVQRDQQQPAERCPVCGWLVERVESAYIAGTAAAVSVHLRPLPLDAATLEVADASLAEAEALDGAVRSQLHGQRPYEFAVKRRDVAVAALRAARARKEAP